MKDFLYLDNDTVLSISAQLFEGNIIETSSSESNTSAESTTDSRTNKSGKYDNVYNFIFVAPLGRPLSRSSIHNTMMYCSEKVLGKDNKMSVHKLRHTHATLLLESNVPMKVIQDRLGHQSMEMTERVYAHVTPTLKESTRKIFEDHIKDLF